MSGVSPVPQAVAVELPAPPEPGTSGARALTTRFLDFWLLGGASLLVWLAMIVAQHFRGNPAVGQHFDSLEAAALTLALAVNYPHFLLSYKLAYSRGRPFVLEHWWALIVVPVALAALFLAAYRFYGVPVAQVAALRTLTTWLLPWGVNAQVVAGPRVGDVLLTAAFNLMVLTIGWHYTKQVFGCMMVYARYDDYPLTPAQRTLTRRALLSVWVMAFVDNNIDGTFKAFGNFSYSSLDLPNITAPLAELAVIIGLVLVVARVFWANYRTHSRLPSLNLLVPFASIYVWWLPQTRQDDFYFLLVPMFHSLQYLPFAFKVEDTRLRGARYGEARGVLLVAGVVLAGWLAFELVPEWLDTRLGTVNAWDLSFFTIAAMLFINLHHYFIDSVVWRLKDRPVREYLFG